MGDEEEEEWGEEEDEEEEGLPRWDFSLQGPKDLAALMASAGFHNIGAPTGAGGVGGDGDDGGGDK